MPFVVSSTIPVPTPSDHRLAVVSLLPRVTSTRGPGLPRLRTSFLGLADLKQSFEAWVKDECEQRPCEPRELLDWWPGSNGGFLVKWSLLIVRRGIGD